MNDSPDDSPPVFRLYTPMQIALASFIGGPLGACWLMGSNYRALGNLSAMRASTLWGVIGVGIIFYLGMVMGEGLPVGILPIGYTLGLYFTAQQLQGEAIKEHLAAGGAIGSWVYAAVAGVFGLALILGMLLVLIKVFPAP